MNDALHEDDRWVPTMGEKLFTATLILGVSLIIESTTALTDPKWVVFFGACIVFTYNLFIYWPIRTRVFGHDLP